MFQDESVKTILARSHKAPQAARHPANTHAPKYAKHRLWHQTTPSCRADAHKWPAVAGFPVDAPRIHFYRVRLNDFKSFDALSKVLFIFPSQYLFAIGLLRLFSLRRSLSPALCTSIKVHDSSATSPVRYNTTDGALTLFGGRLGGTSASGARRGPAAFRLQFAEVTPGDFHCGLFPLPSPVLGESLLVSFPPLNDMLKFSGYSYFTSDAEKIWLSKHWHAETCADSTLNEFTLGSVTTALSCAFTLQSSECFHT